MTGVYINDQPISSIEDAISAIPADTVVINDPDDDAPYTSIEMFYDALLEGAQGHFLTFSQQAWANEQD